MRSEQRLHPLSFLFDTGRHARNLLVPALFVLVTASFASWQVLGVPFFVAYVVVSIVRYLSFRYGYGDDEIVVQGINIRSKHQRQVQAAGRTMSPGIIQFEAPIHISNVKLLERSK